MNAAAHRDEVGRYQKSIESLLGEDFPNTPLDYGIINDLVSAKVYAEIFSEIERFGTPNIQKIMDEEFLEKLYNEIAREVRAGNYNVAPECFLAGTTIDMWDGAKKTIEEITTDDIVVSYDEGGKLVPGRVMRTFENRSKHILDVHGLMITPGHVTFCGKVEGEDNPFAGRHVPILDILRSDGTLMKKDGSLVRAATGAPAGSLEDQKIWAVSGPKEGASIHVAEKGELRLGTRHIMPDGTILSVLDMVARLGAVLKGGFLVHRPDDKAGFIFHWEHTPTLPKPEDYVLQRSALTLADIYSADEWEAVRPAMPAPSMGEAGPSFPRGGPALPIVRFCKRHEMRHNPTFRFPCAAIPTNRLRAVNKGVQWRESERRRPVGQIKPGIFLYTDLI